MIYFDNAASTLQKPDAVYAASDKALREAAGAGRSGHAPAMCAGKILLACRIATARLFGLSDPRRVVFTYNATHALNLAIHMLCTPETRVAVSGYEHNSVMRPLTARRIPIIRLQSGLFDRKAFLQAAQDAVQQGVEVMIVNHVSNVFGQIAPLAEIDALCAKHHIPLVLDASQSAGVLSLDVRQYDSLAFVCMPGHKALYGPTGTGVLLALGDGPYESLLQGGTGSVSEQLEQPAFLPDALESGTQNVTGIAGLCAGLRFVEREGITAIRKREYALLTQTAEGMRSMPETELFFAEDDALQSGVLSFRHRRLDCECIAEELAHEDICVRAGLHCAPLAHQSAGTMKTGTVRLSFSAFNTAAEVDAFLECYRNILKKLTNR